MSAPRTIDVHAHIIEPETVRLLQKATPAARFKLEPIDDEFARFEFGGTGMTPFPRGGWDLERRLRDMDANGFDLQVLSVCTPTILYGLEAKLCLAVSQIQNDQIAARVRAMPDRFLGIATVPLQAPELAAEELRRAMTKLGLRGMEIGSHVNGRNLDDPALEPVWAAAAELGAFILVHPLNAAGVPRLDSYYLKNLIGNPLDTTVAAASLVFGGVLERHPTLTFCMVHGGGFAPYQAARWIHGWEVRGEPKVHLKTPPQASLDRLLYDTVLHDPRPLQYLVDLVGSSRVLLGSDYPFDMGQYDIDIVRSLKVSPSDKASILCGNAVRLVGDAAASKVGIRA
jgi:aminocarboxymuconate-semialdehyde decarboxylase